MSVRCGPPSGRIALPSPGRVGPWRGEGQDDERYAGEYAPEPDLDAVGKRGDGARRGIEWSFLQAEFCCESLALSNEHYPGSELHRFLPGQGDHSSFGRAMNTAMSLPGLAQCSGCTSQRCETLFEAWADTAAHAFSRARRIGPPSEAYRPLTLYQGGARCRLLDREHCDIDRGVRNV